MNLRRAIAVLVLGIAACGGTETEEEVASTASTEAAVSTSGHTISGRVYASHSDPLGGPIHVTIKLVGPVTRTTTSRSSDRSGTYAFTDLPDGNYTLAPQFQSLGREVVVFYPYNRSVALVGADVGGQDFASCYRIVTRTIPVCTP